MSWLVIASISTFVAATCAVVALQRGWRRVLAEIPGDTTAVGARLPALWRLGGVWTRPAGRIVDAYLPGWWRRALLAPLRAAGLEGTLGPGAFVAGQVLAGAALLTLSLAGAAVLRGMAAAHGLGEVGDISIRAAAVLTVFGYMLPQLWLRDQGAERRRQIERQLPALLDLLTIALEAGQSLPSALTLACDRLPSGPLQLELDRVLRDVRAGRPRAEALQAMAERVRIAGVAQLVSALTVGARQGVDLGPLLRAQGAQRRHERFMRAERLALQAPVKMLLPLATCVFPGTFAILFFPVGMQLLQQGLL